MAEALQRRIGLMSIYVRGKDGGRKKIAGVGMPGPAGKSAYKYAVEGGFRGTEAEFAAMVGLRSNPNIADNPDFSINQRGFESDNWTTGYGPDRWFSMGDGHLSYHGKEVTCNGQFLAQFYEAGVVQAGTYTISALCTSNIAVVLGYWDGHSVEGTSANYSNGLASATVTLNSTDTAHYGYMYIMASGGGSVSHVKLERGPTQTLAHQDASGDWVLNDPPNKALELAKCQRYQEEVYWEGLSVSSEGTYGIDITIPFKVTRRAMPINTVYSINGVADKVSYFDGSKWIDVDAQVNQPYESNDGGRYGVRVRASVPIGPAVVTLKVFSDANL